MSNYIQGPIRSVMKSNLFSRVLTDALHAFSKYDNYLVENDTHELSYSHRLAIYIDELLPQYNVDCEWNRNGTETKRILVNELLDDIRTLVETISISEHDVGSFGKDEEEFMLLKKDLEILNSRLSDNIMMTIKDLSEDEYFVVKDFLEEGKFYIKNIRPDIIVHHRGTKQNIAAIEIKKSTNGEGFKDLVIFDLIKLYLMTTQQHLNYKFGYLIHFPKENYRWNEVIIKPSKFLTLLFGAKSDKVFEVFFL